MCLQLRHLYLFVFRIGKGCHTQKGKYFGFPEDTSERCCAPKVRYLWATFASRGLALLPVGCVYLL